MIHKNSNTKTIKTTGLIMVIAILVAAFTLATPSPTPTLPATPSVGTGSHGVDLDGYVSLVDLLREEVTVEPDGEFQQHFFSAVTGYAILVDGQAVQVFEYADATAMEVDAATVSPTGSGVGTSMILWVEPPHFFKGGRVIVLYVGSDTAVLQILETVLGPEFAGR